MLKQRIFEIVFWSFLASYLTAMGFIFSSEQQCPYNKGKTKGYEVENKPLWQKFFPDPSSFFNFSLVLVTGFLVAIGRTRWTEFRYRLPVGLDGINDTSFIIEDHAGNRTS
jgi:hypothetical protein